MGNIIKLGVSVTDVDEAPKNFDLMACGLRQASNVMGSTRGFIGSNLKAICETGRSAFTGRMVGALSPIFGLLAKTAGH